MKKRHIGTILLACIFPLLFTGIGVLTCDMTARMGLMIGLSIDAIIGVIALGVHLIFTDKN